MAQIKTIHIVDDDEIYSFTIERVLARAQIAENVVFFPDGKLAFDFLNENISNPEVLPDMILLDINMPVMNGWGFLDAYATISPRIKKKIVIYMVSSSIAEADLALAKKNKAVTDYLVKPLTINNLIEIAGRLK
ncbi:hypothetical protein A0256_00050 [Mucilaginibacter sp. PAMC 26640]|nr:hypothetical protein A0256_00050 [Mucilaginibacter sp. PAMC 26640]